MPPQDDTYAIIRPQRWSDNIIWKGQKHILRSPVAPFTD